MDSALRFNCLSRFTLLSLLACLVGATCLSNPATAQRPKTAAKEDPALQPRPEALKTKDNVKLSSYYFPAKKKDSKEAVPVIVVHEWKGQAAPYLKLCLALREAGFAVLALEYRGHGKSKQYTDPRGELKDFNISTMGKRDVQAILQYDLESAKQFLKRENNAERLNLNALCLVGIEEGAILAAHWAVRDWNFPTVGRLKQGQDVKGLVYISPAKNVSGLSIDATLRNNNLIRLPTMIVAGTDSSTGSDATRIGKRIETTKKKLGRGTAVGFELSEVKTSLNGPAMLNEVSSVVPSIVNFLKANVKVSNSENPWITR